MAGRGSTGNVIAALASFFLPGLGQLIQGRLGMAIVMAVLAVVVWIITFTTLGWVVNVVAALEAAVWKGGR